MSELSQVFNNQGEVIGKLWGIGSSLIASLLIFLMVIAMIKNKQNISEEIENKVSREIRISSIFLITVLMVAREGFELILFALANTTKSYIAIELTIGIVAACIFGFGLSRSIFKIDLKKLFKYLLIFLIFQVGYLVGDAIHEFIELLEYISIAPGNTLLYSEVYNLSGTFVDSEKSVIGIFANAFFGWYSKPVILQFIGQYFITIYLLYLYWKNK